MPCSDGIGPNEDRSRNTAQLYCYVATSLGTPLANIAGWIKAAAESPWGDTKRTGEMVELLCSVIRGMPEPLREAIMYDGRKRDARRLADWWEQHEEEDRLRVAMENARIERGRVILHGLSEADREAVRAFLKAQAESR